MNLGSVLCVAGIDTDIGKTIATGLIARGLLEAGINVITQKPVQTGCREISEDIVTHRQLMGVNLFHEDETGLTCSYLYETACSPHLASRLENDTIHPQKIKEATERLRRTYDVVLLEGAGGLFVPLQEDFTLIDLFEEMKFPVILVTSSRLGSLNHTISSLEALKRRNILLAGVVYNRYGNEQQEIVEDSLYMITKYVRRYGYDCPLVELQNEELYAGEDSCLPFTVFYDSVFQ